MKCITLLLFAAAAGLAAEIDFATGQAARLFIGQPQATRQDPGATERLLGAVGGVAFANDMLFVADSSPGASTPQNNRVLIFRNVSGGLPRPTDELLYTQRCPICVGQADTVLGQPDFEKTEWGRSQSGMRRPTAVASDGNVLAVADTDNNRVLIWLSIPTGNNQPADVVLGQPDFNTGTALAESPTRSSLLGPQGLWIHNGMLFVADTGNSRVLIWNSFPTQSGQQPDIVLGRPDFNTGVPRDPTKQDSPRADNLLNPVSVTYDGVRLYVADLGYNRVLIWNSLPSSNGAAADVVIGQPDMTSGFANYSYRVENEKSVGVLCAPISQDDEGNDIYPARCNATLSFPRFALSAGERLFIADGGNDRVLVFRTIPTQNGQEADHVLGQLGGGINQASDAADSMRTPMSLAWDGTNLYVTDNYNRRVNVYSMGERSIPYTGVRNAASFEIYAVGGVALSGTVKEGDSITIKIMDKEYTYKITADDTADSVISALVDLINAGEGDPHVLATPNFNTATVQLTSRAPGSDGNQVEYSASTSNNAEVLATAAGATLSGGMDAAKIAPGTLVSIVGDNLADGIESAPPGAQVLPDELAGVQVYFDGVRAPLLYVSPTQINAQVPFEFLDTTSISAYVRIKRADGTVSVTTPVAVSIVQENPGIFTMPGQDPRPAVALHYSSNATGTVSVDGSVSAGDVATVTIEDRSYTYTAQDGDDLTTVRDALIELINQDPKVRAFPAGLHHRIRLQARIAGPAGNGIPFTASSGGDESGVILTPTNTALCCANIAGAPITRHNPAVPGQTLVVYATGMGLPDNLEHVATGQAYPHGAPMHQPREFVSSIAGAKTANVLYAGLVPGQVGLWEVHLELNADLPTNELTQLTIAQWEFVSNIVTIPLVNPNAPPPPVEEEEGEN